MFCPNCGIQTAATSKFCSGCGGPLPVTSTGVRLGAGTVPPPQALPLDATSNIPEGLAQSLGASFAGRYQLSSVLGKGGMGVVYRARDLQLEEDIAIKLLQSQFLTSNSEVERFKKEITTARKITHANVIRIHDLGMNDAEIFISMELLTGGSLAEVIERGTLTVDDKMNICIALCDGLAAVHEQGIVHRDIKSHNVLFDERGRPKLVDFGISRVTAATSHTIGFTGTPHYMSPEQANGEPVTVQSDIYSLGVLFYEMFVGRRPFEADSLARLALMHSQEPPTPPRALNPDVTPEIEAILLKALAKKPSDRYGDVRAMAQDLRAVAAGEQPSLAAEYVPRTSFGSTIPPMPISTMARAQVGAPAKALPGRGRVAWVVGGAVATVVLLVAVVLLFRPASGPGGPIRAFDGDTSTAGEGVHGVENALRGGAQPPSQRSSDPVLVKLEAMDAATGAPLVPQVWQGEDLVCMRPECFLPQMPGTIREVVMKASGYHDKNVQIMVPQDNTIPIKMVVELTPLEGGKEVGEGEENPLIE